MGLYVAEHSPYKPSPMAHFLSKATALHPLHATSTKPHHSVGVNRYNFMLESLADLNARCGVR